MPWVFYLFGMYVCKTLAHQDNFLTLSSSLTPCLEL